MNLIKRWQIIVAKMIVAIVSFSCNCPSAAAYQVDVYFVGTNAFSSAGPSDLFQFDESGPELAKLEVPETGGGQSLATDNDNIFVAESSGAINRYDLQGNFLGEFANVNRLAGQNTIGTVGPAGQTIETDRSGNLYTTFSGHAGAPRTSFRLDQSGAIAATFAHPDLAWPAGIDADANGNVFILQTIGITSEAGLYQFDASGNFVNFFVGRSLFPTNPTDIAINEITNELFIADDTGSIEVFDLSTQPPVLLDTLTPNLPPHPMQSQIGTFTNWGINDVFIEQASGRIFGGAVTTIDTGIDNIFGGRAFRSLGFEMSREGDVITTYNQNTPRSQTSCAIIATPQTVPEPTTLLGDVNQDGLVTFLDIGPFIGFLTSGTYLEEADCNLDGEVNFLDIIRLIAILAGG